jgi:2-polyprenyl-3-methyl-5-hydroxy-6-metoxy-1,4-benzoquinol methylase
MSERQSHWERVYTSKNETEVSWFQQSPETSLNLIRQTGATAESAIIDIGGGASRLVDTLLRLGFKSLAVLDLSHAALAAARARLGAEASRVDWIASDVTQWKPARRYDVWHDRAAFHFLTDSADRAAYLARLRDAVNPTGHVIIGTFATDGPQMCSGLPVQRYDAESLHETLGEGFRLMGSHRETHTTPWGSTQSFQFARFQRVGGIEN